MLDTEQLYFHAFSQACTRHGLTGQREVYLRTIGVDDETELQIYQESFPQLDGRVFYSEIQAYCQEQIRIGHVAVKPGLFALFDAIDEYPGIRKAVVTSNRREMATALLTQTGVWERLDGGVYREMVSHSKPAPDAYELGCRLFSVPPREALVLEDSEPGLYAAQAAGIPVIVVPDLLEPSEQALSGCMARCSCLKEVIPYLHRLI